MFRRPEVSGLAVPPVDGPTPTGNLIRLTSQDGFPVGFIPLRQFLGNASNTDQVAVVYLVDFTLLIIHHPFVWFVMVFILYMPTQVLWWDVPDDTNRHTS